MWFIQMIKNILKYILPPPVRSFMREITGLRELTKEQGDTIRQELDGLRQLMQLIVEKSEELTAQQRNQEEKLNELLAQQLQQEAVTRELLARQLQQETAAKELLAQQLQQEAAAKELLAQQEQTVLRESTGLRQLMAERYTEFTALQKQQSEHMAGVTAEITVQQRQQSEQVERLFETIASQQQYQMETCGQQQEAMDGLLAKLNAVQAELNEKEGQMEWQKDKLFSIVTETQKVLSGVPQIRTQIHRLANGTLRLLPQPRLSYFVLNILDHCNLRCKGCDHFAAIAEKRFVVLDDICRDLERMSYLTHQNVTRIGVMGGEPLLHPQLKEILTVARGWFPQTVVQLVSNGILLLQQGDEFWKVCRDNRISIVVTKYPLKLDFDRMEQMAKDWGVSFEYYGNTGEVIKTSYKMPMDVNGRQDPVRSFWNCYHANASPLLMEGKFYPCTVSPNTRHFNKKFGTKMELEQNDYLDIHSISDIDELYRFLCKPKPFCRYCRTSERSFGHPWETSKQVAEEWT